MCYDLCLQIEYIKDIDCGYDDKFVSTEKTIEKTHQGDYENSNKKLTVLALISEKDTQHTHLR